MFEKPLQALEDHFPEFIITLMSMAWGVMLLLPSNTFAISQGYSLLAAIAPEYVWGLLFSSVSLLMLHGIIAHLVKVVRRTARVLTFMWFMVAIAFAAAAPASAAWPLLLGLAVLFAWIGAEYKVNK